MRRFLVAARRGGALGVDRWDNATEEEKFAAVQHASRAYWDKLSPEQRSAIMKERAAKRRRRRDALAEK